MKERWFLWGLIFFASGVLVAFGLVGITDYCVAREAESEKARLDAEWAEEEVEVPKEIVVNPDHGGWAQASPVYPAYAEVSTSKDGKLAYTVVSPHMTWGNCRPVRNQGREAKAGDKLLVLSPGRYGDPQDNLLLIECAGRVPIITLRPSRVFPERVKVKPGDTLWLIARRNLVKEGYYGLSAMEVEPYYRQVVRENHLYDPGKLGVGQEVLLPAVPHPYPPLP